MKRFLPLLIFVSISFSQKEYNSNDLLEIDNRLYTVKFSDKHITGKVYGYFGEDGLTILYSPKDGVKLWEINFKDGEYNGLWTEWWNDENKSEVKNYKDGKLNGLATGWFENGKKKWERTYKDGEFNGLYTQWYENGQKEFELTYKDGKGDGLHTYWYENGQKKIEGTYKDGKGDGVKTWWDKNGQKANEITFKDGEIILIGKDRIAVDYN